MVLSATCVVYKISWCKGYIGETGRSIQERINEHDRDTRLARSQSMVMRPDTIPLLGHDKFVDHNPRWYTHKVASMVAW